MGGSGRRGRERRMRTWSEGLSRNKRGDDGKG